MLHISVPSMPSMIYWKRGMDEPAQDISVPSMPSVVKILRVLRALRGKKPPWFHPSSIAQSISATRCIPACR